MNVENGFKVDIVELREQLVLDQDGLGSELIFEDKSFL